MKKQFAGFTLIELMVAVTILAIVSAVALPIYSRYSDRTWRSEAQGDLLNCAQALERQASVNFDYRGAAVGGVDVGPIDPALCNISSAARYNIAVTGDDTSFTLVATPIGGIDQGRALMLNSAGIRGWDEDGVGGIEADEMDWEES